MQRFLTLFRVKNSEFEEIALKIVKQFPTESTQTYYIAPLTEGPRQRISKGKVVDKFRNSLRLFRSVDLLPEKKNNEDSNEFSDESQSLLGSNKGNN